MDAETAGWHISREICDRGRLMRATGFIGTVVLVLVMGFGVGPELPGSTETASTDVRPAERPIDTNRASAYGAEAVPGHTSVAAERGRQGTSQWRLRKPASKGQIEGYAHRVSVPSGERVKLKISTGAARFRVVAFRFGAYRGAWPGESGDHAWSTVSGSEIRCSLLEELALWWRPGTLRCRSAPADGHLGSTSSSSLRRRGGRPTCL